MRAQLFRGGEWKPSGPSQSLHSYAPLHSTAYLWDSPSSISVFCSNFCHLGSFFSLHPTYSVASTRCLLLLYLRKRSATRASQGSVDLLCVFIHDLLQWRVTLLHVSGLQSFLLVDPAPTLTDCPSVYPITLPVELHFKTSLFSLLLEESAKAHWNHDASSTQADLNGEIRAKELTQRLAKGWSKDESTW